MNYGGWVRSGGSGQSKFYVLGPDGEMIDPDHVDNTHRKGYTGNMRIGDVADLQNGQIALHYECGTCLMLGRLRRLYLKGMSQHPNRCVRLQRLNA